MNTAGERHRASDHAGQDAQQAALGDDQDKDVPLRPAVAPHDAELDESLISAHQHRIGNTHSPDQEGQADRREQEEVKLPHDPADRLAELADPLRDDARQGGFDAVGQSVGVSDLDGLHGERRGCLIRHLEQPSRHTDFHDDRHVGDERTRVVEADDGEVFRPDSDRLADLPGRTVGIRVVAGDLRADHDVVATDILQVKESSPAPLRRQKRHCKHRTLELEVFGKVLSLDHDHLAQILHCRFARPDHESDRSGPKAALAVDGRGDLPDLGRDDADARDPPQGLGRVRGEVAEDRARRVLAEDQEPLHRAERAAHQVTNPPGDAEEPQEREDRDRQPDDGQGRSRRPCDQVLPGETPHDGSPRGEKNQGWRCSRRIRRTSPITSGWSWHKWLAATSVSEAAPATWALS